MYMNGFVLGCTPVRRKEISSQNTPVVKGSSSIESVQYRQHMVSQEMCQKMFRWVIGEILAYRYHLHLIKYLYTIISD